MIKVELAKLVWSKENDATEEELKEIKREITWYRIDELEKWVSAEEWNNLMEERTEVLNQFSTLEQ